MKEIASEKVRVYPSSRKQLKIIAARFDSTIAETIACLLVLEKRDKNLLPLANKAKALKHKPLEKLHEAPLPS